MTLHPFSSDEEAGWHEGIRRRELIRCSVDLARLAENVQLTEDFASEAPKTLSRVIAVTADLLAQKLESSAPAQDLEQINTLLGIITTHLRYVERARVAQTPWSIVSSAERLFKLTADSKSHFIVRPNWTYNYSIIGEFASAYREFLSCWAWFPLADWKKDIGLGDDESIYCISFPRIERMNCLLHANWGHEVGHILAAKWVSVDFATAWASDESAIKQRIEDHVVKNFPPVDPLFKAMAIQEAVAKQMRATMEAARQGFIELICDRVGVHLLGTSALAATMEFAARFAMDVSPLQSSYYPPWRYRLRMMLKNCAPDLNDNIGIGYPNQEIDAFIHWLKNGQRLTAGTGDLQVIKSNVVTIEPRKIQERQVIPFGERLVLHPGVLVLACTFEYVSIPGDLECQVEGRSSWARLGLQVATATSIEPGFKGVITLELSNVATVPLALMPGIRIAQLLLRKAEPPVDDPYSGNRKYRCPIGPEFSRLHEDYDWNAFAPKKKS